MYGAIYGDEKKEKCKEWLIEFTKYSQILQRFITKSSQN